MDLHELNGVWHLSTLTSKIPEKSASPKSRFMFQILPRSIWLPEKPTAFHPVFLFVLPSPMQSILETGDDSSLQPKCKDFSFWSWRWDQAVKGICSSNKGEPNPSTSFGLNFQPLAVNQISPDPTLLSELQCPSAQQPSGLQQPAENMY